MDLVILPLITILATPHNVDDGAVIGIRVVDESHGTILSPLGGSCGGRVAACRLDQPLGRHGTLKGASGHRFWRGGIVNGHYMPRLIMV